MSAHTLHTEGTYTGVVRLLTGAAEESALPHGHDRLSRKMQSLSPKYDNAACSLMWCSNAWFVPSGRWLCMVRLQDPNSEELVAPAVPTAVAVGGPCTAELNLAQIFGPGGRRDASMWARRCRPVPNTSNDSSSAHGYTHAAMIAASRGRMLQRTRRRTDDVAQRLQQVLQLASGRVAAADDRTTLCSSGAVE